MRLISSKIPVTLIEWVPSARIKAAAASLRLDSELVLHGRRGIYSNARGYAKRISEAADLLEILGAEAARAYLRKFGKRTGDFGKTEITDYAYLNCRQKPLNLISKFLGEKSSLSTLHPKISAVIKLAAEHPRSRFLLICEKELAESVFLPLFTRFNIRNISVLAKLDERGKPSFAWQNRDSIGKNYDHVILFDPLQDAENVAIGLLDKGPCSPGKTGNIYKLIQRESRLLNSGQMDLFGAPGT